MRTYVQKMLSVMGMFMAMILGAVGCGIIFAPITWTLDPISVGTIFIVLALVERVRYFYSERNILSQKWVPSNGAKHVPLGDNSTCNTCGESNCVCIWRIEKIERLHEEIDQEYGKVVVSNR